ncbi:ATP-binding protein [Persephonella sp.]
MKTLEKVLNQLESIHTRLKFSLPEKIRPLYDQINIENIRDVIVYGSRGVGKTTFLLYKSINKNFLYFSADNPIVSSLPLFDLVEYIYSQGYEGVVIDEIYFANDWSQHLKAIYDSFPDRYIWVSGSSNLILRDSVADLSRRFSKHRIPMLSFREYLAITEGVILEPVDIFNLKLQLFKDLKGINILKVFKDYISSGIRPFFVEGDYCIRLKGIIEKSIFHDVPFFVSSIQENHLRLMNSIIGHLILSPVPTINVSKMCSQWHVSKEKLYNLLYVMEYAEIIKIIRKKKEKTRTFSKGSKIFIYDPSVYYCFEGNKGTAREAFIAFALSEKYRVYASENEKEYDFLVEDYKIEVGGKNKKPKKADIVLSDDIEFPVRNKIPLWLAGMVF